MVNLFSFGYHVTDRAYVRTYSSTDCTGEVGETIKRKGGVSQACLGKSTSFFTTVSNLKLIRLAVLLGNAALTRARMSEGRCPQLLLRAFSAHAKVVARDAKEMRNTQDTRTDFVSSKSGRF